MSGHRRSQGGAYFVIQDLDEVSLKDSARRSNFYILFDLRKGATQADPSVIVNIESLTPALTPRALIEY